MSTSLQILFFVAMVILCAKLFGAIAARLGLPLVLGELLAGVFLGPTVLNIGSFSYFAAVPDANAVPVAAVFKVMAAIGVVVLMFVTGLETDIAMMRRTVAPAFWAASGGVVLPMLGGCLLAHYAGFGWPQAIFIGTILTATSVTVTAQTLVNLGQLRSKPGSTILGAAVIDDVLGLVVLSLVIALSVHTSHSGGNGWTGIAITLARMAICLVLLFWAGPPVTRWVFRQASRLHGPHSELAAALTIGLLLAFLAEWLGGMAAITGAYLAGLFVAATPAHGKVTDDLRAMTNSFFGPLFFVSIGLEVNARQLAGRTGLFVLLVAVAVLGKILGSGLGARLTGFSNRDSLIVGVGMIPRGEVGLITASLGFAAGLVSPTVYVQVVILVLATTLVTPPLLKMAFPRGVPETSKTGLGEFPSLDELSGAVADVADA
ncbi:MAG: cation:proton antiporter [Acidobacteriia bacterium]|nr:cation:proton antiporter [Terriglobia bacterium]